MSSPKLFALCVLLAATTANGAIAQSGNIAQRAQRAESYTPDGKKIKKTEARYPNATRKEPKLVGSSRMSRSINKMIDAFNDDEFATAISGADAILNDPKANAYDRAKAAQIAAYAWNATDSDDAYSNAIRYLRQAIEADALPNDDHFELLYVLAQMQLAEDQYQDALASADRFLKETSSDRALVHALRGNALFRLDRYEEAVDAFQKAIAAEANPDRAWSNMLMASYFELNRPQDAARVGEELVAKNPSDKSLLLNLASIYLQAEQPAKAGEVFDRLRSQNLLTESRDYESAYRLLANIDGRENDAISVINEGLERGILTPTAEIYNFLAQAYYFSDRIELAIDAWGKAAPLAGDGESYLNLGKVLVQEARFAESKAAVLKALEKGVKKPGDAWMTIARAEYGEDGKNRSAILAAYREAAKYPETKAQAERAIAQMTR